MIADLIEGRFGVRYHNHHISRLLNELGFSVQRPRKRLARADDEAQAHWLRTKLPAIKKSRCCRGVVMYGDEANLAAEGKVWLAANRHRLVLFRLPPYSPELNPIEGVWKGVWKVTKRTTTHNRFFRNTHERDAALTSTFESFNAYPKSIAGHVARFL